MEATARHIQTVGFEKVDVDEVLAEVGVTTGALYHYFESFSDLLTAGLLHAFEEGIRESEGWARSLRDESRSALHARDHLHSIIAESLKPHRQPFRSLRLKTLSLILTEPTLAEKVSRRQADLTELTTEVFRELQTRGWVRGDLDPQVLAVLIQSLTLGRIVDDVVDEGHRMDVSAWQRTTEDIFDSFFIVDDGPVLDR